VKIAARLLGVSGCVLSILSPSVTPAAEAQARPPAAVSTAKSEAVDDLVSRLSRRIPEWMEQAVVPGVQIAVLRDGATAWHGAFGVANVETRTPVTDTSVFEAASLSKPVFAYAVLKLADAGRLDLDRPLATYLPGGYDVGDDDRLSRITARHVLTHQTGFPNWRPGGQPLKIHFAPGERFSYSGEGFVYLAAVVERITGETLEAFMKRSVFDPLGMTSSSYVFQERFESLKVYNHGLLGGLAGRRTPWRANAAASLHTTAEDYARLVSAVMAGTGLRPSTARQLLSPQSRPDEAGTNTATVPPTGRAVPSLAWGLGWGLEQDDYGWSLWHWGDNGPTKAYVAASPSRRLGVVVFLNSENGLSIVPAVLAEVFGGPRPSSFAWLKVQEYVPALGRFVRAVQTAGVSQALDEYRASRKARPADAPLSEETMNRIGYVLLRDKKVKEAIEVFSQNVSDHPESWNVFDSLGEAYAADGNTERAIKAYERSLALNPANTAGAEALKRLRNPGSAR
jgi:CubicO group peptidase (beta-lactamase class C family)